MLVTALAASQLKQPLLRPITSRTKKLRSKPDDVYRPRCLEQRSVADRMFMDFKYTRPGSKEQLQALATLSFLIGMWADFLTAEEKRMDQALALEGR